VYSTNGRYCGGPVWPTGYGDRQCRHHFTGSALFLVSEKAKHITGQTLIVDGGWTSISPSPF